MKKDPDYFAGHEPSLLYIAKRMSDAAKVEAILSEAGVDFGVEADEYQGGVVFRSVRMGAFFYVLPEARANAAAVLRAHHFVPARE